LKLALQATDSTAISNPAYLVPVRRSGWRGIALLKFCQVDKPG
jgi:hypothetical protein